MLQKRGGQDASTKLGEQPNVRCFEIHHESEPFLCHRSIGAPRIQWNGKGLKNYQITCIFAPRTHLWADWLAADRKIERQGTHGYFEREKKKRSNLG